MKDIHELEARLGYTFKDEKLLLRALTHRSYAHEHNERLEFLGDSVLNCVVGNALFLRDRHFTEGMLSRVRANLVCEKTLKGLAETISISDYLRLGEGEAKTGGAHRPSIMADAMEALFGAVFMESGFEAAQQVVLKLYEPILTELSPEQLGKDPKTRLQERLQGLHLERPLYTVLSVTGASHLQTFTCECRLAALNIVTTGEATSRRAAEQAAAALALDALEAHPEVQKHPKRH